MKEYFVEVVSSLKKKFAESRIGEALYKFLVPYYEKKAPDQETEDKRKLQEELQRGFLLKEIFFNLTILLKQRQYEELQREYSSEKKGLEAEIENLKRIRTQQLGVIHDLFDSRKQLRDNYRKGVLETAVNLANFSENREGAAIVLDEKYIVKYCHQDAISLLGHDPTGKYCTTLLAKQKDLEFFKTLQAREVVVDVLIKRGGVEKSDRVYAATHPLVSLDTFIGAYIVIRELDWKEWIKRKLGKGPTTVEEQMKKIKTGMEELRKQRGLNPPTP